MSSIVPSMHIFHPKQNNRHSLLFCTKVLVDFNGCLVEIYTFYTMLHLVYPWLFESTTTCREWMVMAVPNRQWTLCKRRRGSLRWSTSTLVAVAFWSKFAQNSSLRRSLPEPDLLQRYSNSILFITVRLVWSLCDLVLCLSLIHEKKVMVVWVNSTTYALGPAESDRLRLLASAAGRSIAFSGICARFLHSLETLAANT